MSPVKLREKIQQFFEKITYKQLVILAVVFSCLMGVLVYAGLSRYQQPQQQATKPVETMQVVVAAQDIPERTFVTEDMVKMVDVPKELVPDGAYDTLSDVVNHPTSTSVAAGDVMSDKKVYADVRMAGFTGSIPPNCRAITIGINDVTGISGFAKPGDSVDIMLVRNDSQSGVVRSQVLLQNVLLLAVNKNTGDSAAPATASNSNANSSAGDSKGNSQSGNAQQAVTSATQGAVNMTSVTLALPMDQAIRVAAATQAGTLYLVLRPLSPDETVTPDFSYEMQGQSAPQQQQSAPAPAAPAQPAPQETQQTQQSAPTNAAATIEQGIEVIRGTQSSRVGVNR